MILKWLNSFHCPVYQMLYSSCIMLLSSISQLYHSPSICTGVAYWIPVSNLFLVWYYVWNSAPVSLILSFRCLHACLLLEAFISVLTSCGSLSSALSRFIHLTGDLLVWEVLPLGFELFSDKFPPGAWSYIELLELLFHFYCESLYFYHFAIFYYLLISSCLLNTELKSVFKGLSFCSTLRT